MVTAVKITENTRILVYLLNKHGPSLVIFYIFTIVVL